VAFMLVPLFVRRRGAEVPPPSVVDESVCTGCTQCSLDCPYEAITMIQRPPGGRSLEVARVDPALCVSCGICAGSCAPMAVGPPGRTGREQLAALRTRIAEGAFRPGAIIALCCERGARAWGDRLVAEGAELYPVDCTGSAHTSVIELFVRSGAGGVLVLSCPPRDCWNREGPKWTGERLFHDREAELQARVDRRRVRMVDVAAGDAAKAVAALRAFSLQVAALDAVVPEGAVEVGVECDPVVVSEDA
jgi:ferredoxin